MSRYDQVCADLIDNPKQWLVTGAAGFIGSALVEKLLFLGQPVVGLDSFVTGHQHNVDDVRSGAPDGAKYQFIKGDIRDLETCKQAVQGCDYVLHQAALGSVPRSIEDPLSSHQSNVNGFLNMLLAARDAKVERMVYASSSSVYGDHPGLPKVEDRIGRQLSPYAITKYINELYAGVVQDTYGLELVGLRYFNVFGRRQDPKGAYAAVIPRWIQRLLDGERCLVFGDGSQSRDFCYIDNTVQANLLSATADSAATNRAYNVGVGGRTDLNELYRLIRDDLARNRPELAGIEPEYEAPRRGDVQHSQANIDALVEATGYSPTHEISDGMSETVAWFTR